MVLVTHHTQSSFAAVPVRTSSWSKGISVRQNVVWFQKSLRTDRHISLKHSLSLRSVSRYVSGAKRRSLHISSFKGNVQNENGGNASNKSIAPKSSVQISFLPHDRKENSTDSDTSQDMPVSSDNTLSQSQPISRLFSRWLSLLRTGATAKTSDGILERASQIDHLGEKKTSISKGRSETLKAVVGYFLGLDATIMVPLIIFIPGYLAVNLKYGSQVSRELTPLWIIGPLIVALYVKLLRWIFALYVFTFKQTVKVTRNLPTYCSVASNYINEGKLKEDIRALFWKPITNLKKIDYKELAIKNMKVIQEWVIEHYLDFVESIWPHYCKTIRFLKRANLL